MQLKRIMSAAMLAALTTGALVAYAPMAQAQSGYYDRSGHYHTNHRTYYYDRRRHGWFDTKTGKILKGALVGAGVGAGAGLLLERNVGKTALVGAGIGAGTQAVRYSSVMRQHPILSDTAYGALAGSGVSAATGKKLGTGAMVGGAVGAGLGVLKHY